MTKKTEKNENVFIRANWPAPKNVHALMTTRAGGFSQGKYASFNLAAHTQDNIDAVLQNRKKLNELLNLPRPPLWLEQTHSSTVITTKEYANNKTADAIVSRDKNIVCPIMTGDCLPILICNKQGNEIAAIHAGWRSLAGNIIQNTIAKLNSPKEDLLVWLGPCISGKVYEVGNEVKQAFPHHLPQIESCFTAINSTHSFADLKKIARYLLQYERVTEIYDEEYCTYSQEDLFFSYRRDGQTGRMVSLIWFS